MTGHFHPLNHRPAALRGAVACGRVQPACATVLSGRAPVGRLNHLESVR
jgi:hypothetical protein